MNFPYSSTSLLIFTLIFLSSSPLTSPQSPSPSPSTACKSTPYPKLCRQILSTFKPFPDNSSSYGYSKFTIKQCLKQAHKLSNVINDYLTKRSSLRHVEAAALGDCRDLTELNVEYLSSVSEELKSANTLTGDLVETVTTLLSGVVTNQQTCYDGLVEAKSGLVVVNGGGGLPLSNVTQLYSVSLGLVTEALERNVKKTNKRKKAGKGRVVGSPNPVVREPLQTLIKVLHRNACHGSKTCSSSAQRILSEANNGGGILVRDSVIVNQNGTQNFTTIGDAIAIAPNNSKIEEGYFVIYAQQGLYEEYVVVPKNKKNIMLIGDGINRTIISGNHSVVDGWTTFNSSTFAVSGERFVAVGVTFRNTAGPQKHQAVALRNNADLSTFYQCSFEGYQDTLYIHSLRQFYRECDVYGTVDFIFGNAAAVFQNCNLYARKPMLNQKNAFTAQGRIDPNQNTGISIHNCTIEAATDLALDVNSTTLNYLGRPWKEYSRTVIMQSYIGNLIHPRGWLEWNGTVGTDTLFYAEYANYGPGSNTSSRVEWPGYLQMNASMAMNFTVYNFTMGDTWLPDTDIPFNGGLL
ncbi:probable pectinesterase/pectinesterase inhibitor 25 [Rutidosis leptorrhynchoides]|uniref:probable pectinesterase/pectinesterase inhibitor 25 n=1 Tax=Rutidosis leptorrhynchoides TaxID=125765 RepID=UPI003A9A13F4